MFQDIKVFLIIWGSVVMSFTFFFNNIFLSTGMDIEKSFVYCVQTALGEIDLEIFDFYDDNGRHTTKLIGVYSVLFFVFLNVLVLLNFVIAMMADTYAMMTSVRNGLYNYSIIKSAPSFKPEKQYGGLILTPPFCLISFLVLPLYILIKDKRKLNSLNNGLYLIYYSLLSVPMSAVFLALNLLFLPFAYTKTCF